MTTELSRLVRRDQGAYVLQFRSGGFGIVSAGEMHVIRDGFLYAFGENIISLISRGVEFDSAFMNALRLIIVEHIIKNYTPERANVALFRPSAIGPHLDEYLGRRGRDQAGE